MKSATVARAPFTVSAKSSSSLKAAVPARAFIGSTKALSTKAFGKNKRMAPVMALGFEKVAEGYASALAEVATSNNSLEAVHSDMENLEALMTDEISAFLCNPLVPDGKKKEVVIKIAEKAQMTPYSTNFLKLLVDKSRMAALPAMIEAFDGMYCSLTDTEVATVTSAVKLESEEQFLIAKKLQELTGAKNIKLKPAIDEELIGGYVINYGENGSSMIDQSIKGKFERLEQSLVAETI
jgi:F-type H+-transporting ATPase subunit delta